MQKKYLIEELNKQIEFQNKLNIITCGSSWTNGVSKKTGKVIDWIMCFDMELSEFVESFPWKHWKDVSAKPDIVNAQIELVDCWHFILSDLIKQREHNSIDDGIAELIFDKYSKRATLNVLSSEIVFNSTIKYLKHFINDPINNPYTYHSTLEYFFALCESLELSLEKLFALYYGKNILNEFRQLNGYEKGTYKKIWNNQEDNIAMYNIVIKNPNIPKEKLMDQLNIKYSEVKNA